MPRHKIIGLIVFILVLIVINQLMKPFTEVETIPTTGKIVEKYDSGEIKAVIPYKEGKKHGKVIWYYSSGIKKSETQYIEGKPIASQIFYYENGSPKTYNFFDGIGTGIFQRKYTLDGKIVSNSGKPAIILSDNNLEGIKLKEGLIFGIICATPPEAKTLVRAELKRNPPLIIYEEYLSVDSLGISPIELQFDEIGEEELLIIGKIEDTLRNDIFTDTMLYKINVIE